MPRFPVGCRFSLLSLFGLVTVLALGLASLIHASPLLASAWFTAAVVFLLTSTLLASIRQGEVRVFWFGCTVVGWIYVVVTFSPLIGSQVAPPLLTSQGLAWLDKSLGNDDLPHQKVLYTTSSTWLAGNNMVRIWDSNTGYPQGLREANVQQIGHSIIAVLLAIVGGLFLRYLCSRDTEPDSNQPTLFDL